MGVVVAAHHVHLDERVAIKFLLPESLANAEAVARFAREARAAVKIKSEHVARVSDVGTLENGAPYLVMEYLEGGDLAAWLKEKGPLPIEQAIEFVLQACEALAEAHALGIVHRDLKPANLFVVRRADGLLSVKVLDFGISKVTRQGGAAEAASMTRTSALLGSPLYMSPEQMQSSKDVDVRSDIWSLGVILYELVTGTTPFCADSMPTLILEVLKAEPPPLRNKRPDAPEGLDSVIRRCLQKERSQRYSTVGDLAHALVPLGPARSQRSLERISGVLREAGMGVGEPLLAGSSDASPGPTSSAWGRTGAERGRGAIGVGLGLVAVVLVAAGLVFITRPSASESNVAPTSAASVVPAPVTSVILAPSSAPVAAEPVAPGPVAVEPAPSPLVEPRPASSLAARRPPPLPGTGKGAGPVTAGPAASSPSPGAAGQVAPPGASASAAKRQKPSLHSLIDDRK
jgi:serine/threonine-protein kinase